MLVPGILGFQGLLLLLVLACFLVIRHKWKNAVVNKEEIMRLVAMASEETAVAEFQATSPYAPVVQPVSLPYHCAVCYASTTMRCSKCKAVRYCSGKCQIIHWRQGHKDECQPSIDAVRFQDRSDFHGESISHHDGKGSQANLTTFSTASWVAREKLLSDGVAPDQLENMSSPSGCAKLANIQEDISHANKLSKMKSSHIDKEVESTPKIPKAKKNISGDAQPENIGSEKLTRRLISSEKKLTDACKSKSSSSNDTEDESKEEESLSHSVSIDRPSSATGEHMYSSSRYEKIEAYHALPANEKVGSIPNLPQNARNGLKTSVRKVVQQFKSSKQLKSDLSGRGEEIVGKYKVIFPYELFVKLYSYDNVDLCPFGLMNCGNSCYANAVLQCLAFTRPLASYLLQGLHSRACQKHDWCFICEFEILLMKAREGKSLLSPIRILSKIHKIGSHLGHGREEDAHEFLRYAVDTMQSVCLKEAGAVGPLAEETTLVGMTFGGYLRSKITCMKCLGKSERFEQMMDLTVEIDGEIGTLEEALAQFTATETLDGKNRYHCSRCKSYEKAKKKLTVMEAPNILTIVLKRFQSRNFEKLNKSVRFPEVLNMSPYMGGTSDRSVLYSLYAVVVHLDIMNAAYSGHYVCYVKNNQGEWFKIDDSSVEPVDLKRVLSQGAYMLLYARRTPRPPAFLGSSAVSNGEKLKRRNLEAVPSSHTKSKSRSNSVVPSLISNQSRNQDPDDWRFHPTHRYPALDSSSESSSIFSSSDASSCSTASTKDSSSNEDFSDYIFGETGPDWYSQYSRHSSAAMTGLDGERTSTVLCSDRSRHRRKSTSD
ncbi:unnamed protein product [Prunus armeniaca]|uniref:ubiquitinyl hydrolase 1 n=1 Tax=Prunus armeniaca TaxID=36596 RepID=A0A6J5XJX8_PRUAR|nr:unnamed protein product [Prunus armeniaca]